MDTKKNEQLVYLKDLLFVVLRNWRKLLVVAVIFAILLGGAKLCLGVRKIAADNAFSVEALPQAKAQYAQQLKDAEAAVEAAEKELNAQQTYMEESILMRLDPDEYYLAEVTFFVKTDGQVTGVDANKILKKYIATIQSDLTAERIGRAVKEAPNHLKQVLFVVEDEEIASLRMACSCDTEPLAEQMQKAMKEAVLAMQEDVALLRGEHELIVIDEGISERSNGELINTQNEAQGILLAKEAAVRDAEAVKAALVEPTAVNIPKSEAVKPAIKFVVLGAVIGIALVAVYLWLDLIFGNKVYSLKNLVNATGVKMLGCVSAADKQNYADRWVCKWEGRAVADRQTRVQLLAADLGHRCSAYQRVLVTGDGDAQQRKTLVEALMAQAPGLHLIDKGSLLQDADAVEELAQCDAVVLIEQCHYSAYSAVEQEMTMISDYSKKLVGCVLLDG